MSFARRTALAFVLTLACGATTELALADPADKATAQILFEEGRKLLESGQYKDACRKLEESQRLDASMGTQYRLAECYEKLGRTASAWANFREVADQAKAAGLTDREKKARERASLLEPKLAHLTIVVPFDPPAGMIAKRDGAIIGQGQFGTAVPVDSGKHVVEVSLPGKKTWTVSSEVADAASVTVTVPVFDDGSSKKPPTETAAAPIVTPDVGAPTPAPTSTPPTPTVDEVHPAGMQRTVGLVVAAAGVVTIGVSTALILGAKSSYSESDPHCVGNVCDPTGIEIRDAARARGTVATVVFGFGASALILGGVLFFTSPSNNKNATVTHVGIGPGSFFLQGRF